MEISGLLPLPSGPCHGAALIPVLCEDQHTLFSDKGGLNTALGASTSDDITTNKLWIPFRPALKAPAKVKTRPSLALSMVCVSNASFLTVEFKHPQLLLSRCSRVILLCLMPIWFQVCQALFILTFRAHTIVSIARSLSRQSSSVP